MPSYQQDSSSTENHNFGFVELIGTIWEAQMCMQ